MENLTYDELTETNGGGLGAAIGLGLAVVTFGIYLYNEGGDFVQGWEDAESGNYNPPSDCTC